MSEINQDRITTRREVQPDNPVVYPTEPQNFVFTVGSQSKEVFDLGIELPKVAKVRTEGDGAVYAYASL